VARDAAAGPVERADTRGALRGPVLDIRVRWRAGQVALALAAVMALVALARPLSAFQSPRLRLAVTLALGLGTAGSALLASLRGRGRGEQLALFAFLALSIDGLGQLLAPLGWPVWPLMAVLAGSLAVAESLAVALGIAALASLLAVADAAQSSLGHWQQAVAASLGYGALVLALNRGLLGEKRRLSATLAELARIQHGIDQLDEVETPPRPSATALTLRQISEEGRRARQLVRAADLDEALGRLVRLARAAVDAHALLYLEVDREREVAYVRASDGPEALVRDALLPLSSDPIAFVLDRRQAFYATDFRRLLWSLPYYRSEVKVGTLLAMPVRMGEVVSGILVADSIEIQSLTGREPGILEAFAEMVADHVRRTRASAAGEDLGQEFKAVYAVSRNLATLTDPERVRRILLRSARDVVSLEGAAVVTTDDPPTRYVVHEAHGWAKDFEGREVSLAEKTWTAWVLRSAEEPYLLDSVAGHETRMPILVLDEGAAGAESLLAVPLKARNRTLGGLILTGRRGAFDATAHRVLGILANQAAAALSNIQLLERIKELAVRDGLTGLYNRRAFSEQLIQSLAREERQQGRLALLLLDIDHFKKLNDTFGHPAGDAALRNTAETLQHHLRKADQAARYGGEEFAVILPGADEAGALQMAERVRQAIQKGQVIFEGARLAVTASFGVAVWPTDARQADTLLSAADRALYAAKQGGRNRVVAASAVAALRQEEGHG
jgi:diguanylate cyclase (GGDEF)-like protein